MAQACAIAILSCLLAGVAVAVQPVCREIEVSKSGCQADEDCKGLQTVCRGGTCVCPDNFEEFDVDSDGKIKVCRPAPDKINDQCQRYCKPPLICRDGKCICWRATASGNQCTLNCPAGQTQRGQECVPILQLGGSCQDEDDCAFAFGTCRSGRCECAEGTKRVGVKCVATCPDGQPPSGTCRKLHVNSIEIVGYNGKMDTCGDGQTCVTFGKPMIGHCCRVYCPYGTPDTTRTCQAGATEERACRELTHFCHSLEGYGYRTTLCCPRPCREPTPLFINGQCYPLARWNDPCDLNEQCEGGRSMACTNGRCACRGPEFAQRNGTFPTCVRTCPDDSIAIAGTCYKRVGLRQPCLAQEQCPSNARCEGGVCTCSCAAKEEGGRCVGSSDLSFSNILSGFSKFIGGSG